MRNKFLLIFLGIGLLPFLLLLLYILFFAETKIIDKLTLEQENKAEIVLKQISSHLDTLQKEVKFLSSLELMDDLLAEDIDKRISRLLYLKRNDFKMDLSFSIISLNNTILASSDKELLGKHHSIQNILQISDGMYRDGEELFIYSHITASFNKTQKLGVLILRYNLENLNFYLSDKGSIHSYIIDPKLDFIIGKKSSLVPDFHAQTNNIINKEHLIVYKNLLAVLHEFYIVYAVDKAIALEFLYDFIRFMLYISIFILILIVYLALKYSKAVVKPIQKTISASDAKSAFISNMSHELRTPLNAIIGFSQNLITYEDLKEEQLDTVGNIESSAQYLLSMINDILDIAKIEAGKMEVNLQNVDILELTEECHAMMDPLAEDKDIHFSLIHKDLHNRQHFTDSKIYKQILLNLISNAIKFTKEGSITLRLYTGEEKLFISIQDTGIGITKDNIKMLFEDFTQLENIMHKQHKGSGLGLSLSKKMASILGGDIEIQSDGLGLGTTMILTLPINKPI